ncbi:SHOCT domain-containing protein [Knoellia koreensis]|uniref:SHOCT domain-containing protein n=1 Tax=Knoellia koreensis TaxID=2730921 RepID=A0A849HD69_9MICO|nr:SHOCT domain-containing protein [Knoellia sp. DB2414S]NNM47840.1 SHOCT domain-containing protein [Knoellia sp. DB2414S]
MMWSNGMGWTGWLFMAVTAFAFWALAVAAVVALFRGARPGNTSRGPEEDHGALQILDQRFARGEIDVEEYHARQNVLRSAH